MKPLNDYVVQHVLVPNKIDIGFSLEHMMMPFMTDYTD